ncbi:hypothetical protein G6F56_000352 [Rhizopus delemar]|uniref:FAD dependent oxidoreductase domain-containing protein n=1 Tax=Rhizopus stolonifer TaxID=4846 RepID=A0A367KLU1_RHIST|nr:hypothetical protein G6F56_000352 [Rhizopus delemar]RCI03129.1 hypothetical protein CU098_009994 [Rhizopus stolonifer]
MSKVVVIGAGVCGLTTGICLLKSGYSDVLIIAKHLPGDLSSEYTSAWAGASILAHAKYDNYRMHDSKREFAYLADHVPDAHVIRVKGVQYLRNQSVPKEQNYRVKEIYDNVQIISKNNLIPGASEGYTFDGCGRVERREIEDITEAIEQYSANIIVNCTGFGSFNLKDVKDTNLFALRGQTILVRAPHIKTQYYDNSDSTWTYIIPRNDGTVICGGTVDLDNKSTAPDKEIAQDIMNRVYELCPGITHGKGPDAFDIIAHNVGFRPARKDGIRLEKETKVRSNGQKVIICHNYGHGSYGKHM